MTKKQAGKLKNLNISSDNHDDTTVQDADLETVTLRYDGHKNASVSYAPNVAPHRYEINNDKDNATFAVPSILTNKPDRADKSSSLPLALMSIGLFLTLAWMGFSLLIAGTGLAAQIESVAYTILPAFVAFVAIALGGLLWRMDNKRTHLIQATMRDIFDAEKTNLVEQNKDAQTLTKTLADVQVHIRGVNNQFWALQKNVKDINNLKTDLEFLGQEISTFSTVSRRTLMDWETQMSATNDRLNDMERTTSRLSHDSLETCSFLADRLDEVNEQITALNDLQSDAATGVRQFDDVVRTARDDMKELITESKKQSEAAAVAQDTYRTALKSHVSDLSTELTALGNMAKAFDGVRADMGQAGDLLSRGVRESLMDVKLLLDDWKQTKSQLERVLSSSKENVSLQFEQQLGAAKEFLSDWDYMLESRLNLLTSTKETIEKHLTDLPDALHATSKAILTETPDLVSQLSGFRHAAAGMQQSIREAQEAAQSLSETTPDLSKLKIDMDTLSSQASKASTDIIKLIETTKPGIDNVDDVTARVKAFFESLESKTDTHMRQFTALETMIKRFENDNSANNIKAQFAPVLSVIEKLDERCDGLERKAILTREEFESMDIKPLMKSIVLDVEAVFDQTIDIMSSLKPMDKTLRNRDDLPALTLRLRQILESIRPDVLESSIRSRPELNEKIRKFTGRFGVICEQARASSPQGEWVAAALASSELGKIYRMLLKSLEKPLETDK